MPRLMCQPLSKEDSKLNLQKTTALPESPVLDDSRSSAPVIQTLLQFFVPFFSWLPNKIHSQHAKARIYTKGQICKLLQEAGFNILESHYVTAPMDVIKWKWLKSLLRKTIFRGDTTIIPMLSTSIMVICKKE